MDTSRPVNGLPFPPWRAEVILLAMVALTCMLLPPPAGAAGEQERPLEVIILNGTDPYLPAFITLDRAVRERIRSGTDRRVEFYSENLDVARFPRIRFESGIIAMLRQKYRGRRVDAVVAVTAQALAFAQAHADTLWPGSPIVFYALANSLPGTLDPGLRVTGLGVNYEIVRTVGIGLKLVPEARRLVVIGGSSEFDQAITRFARSELARLPGTPDTEYLLGRPLPDVLREVSALSPATLILYLSMFRDTDGGQYVPQQVLAEIAQASRAPVVSPVESYVGSGVVAGSMASYAEQGHAVGDIVLEVLQGTDATVPPPRPPLPGRCIADWNMLQRLGLDESRLPGACEVRFRELSAWDRYGWQIGLGLAVIALQALLIAALVLQRRRRARAELALQENRVELAHAGRLATLGELTASIAHEINQPLGAILSNADAAEMSLDSGRPDLDTVRQIIADIRRDDLRASHVVKRLREMLARKAVDSRRLSINEAIREVLEMLDTEIRRRGVRVHTRLDPELPEVEGDRVHLQQVVLNLLVNAMDAMSGARADGRRVDITTTLAGHDGIEVSVSDRGHGIAPEALPRLFDSFHSGKPQGLGLGLSIARSIVEAHGGRIRAENRPDAGAVFRFTLPVAGSNASRPNPGTQPLATGGAT